MPEGDTIFRAARTLNLALAGRIVTRFESAYPALTRVDTDTPLAGRTVDGVASRGKHLLIRFSGDLTLRTHMRMNGSWHVYKPGERWQRPARDMRVLVATGAYVAVGFNIPEAEFLTAKDLSRHHRLQALGPDLADAAFDRDEAVRRIRSRPDTPLEELLLDQRVIAGIGNVLKSETLFVAGVSPFDTPAHLDDASLRRLVDLAKRLMNMNVDPSAALAPVVGRRTTGSLDPEAKLWVYGRAGQRCRKCGTAIQLRKTGADARLTYWCPSCQRGWRDTQNMR